MSVALWLIDCEVDIDACALPNNTCPPKTQCLDLPGGLEYTCRVPCPQNLQVGRTNSVKYLSLSWSRWKETKLGTV
uniref:Uncharacterized protein n=1 Tax=Sparus aurata TaxID=8175 RepID=A0A671WSU8_SPAAU